MREAFASLLVFLAGCASIAAIGFVCKLICFLFLLGWRLL